MYRYFEFCDKVNDGTVRRSVEALLGHSLEHFKGDAKISITMHNGKALVRIKGYDEVSDLTSVLSAYLG